MKVGLRSVACNKLILKRELPDLLHCGNFHMLSLFYCLWSLDVRGFLCGFIPVHVFTSERTSNYRCDNQSFKYTESVFECMYVCWRGYDTSPRDLSNYYIS